MRNISDLHPTLQDKVYQLVDLCAKKGITISIGECVRTVAEQDALYAQGRTTPGNIVTNAKGSTYSSMHQWGVAFDFFLKMDVDGDGSVSDDAFNDSTGLFEAVGAIGKSIGLEWGGDWTSIKDRPHFQLPNWGSTASKLRSSFGNPDKFKATWKKTTSGGNSNKQDTNTANNEEGTATVIAASGLNVRKSPSTKADLVTSIPTRKTCVLLELNAETANGYDWAKVRYNGKIGYVAQKYLAVVKYPQSSTVMNTSTNTKVNYSKTTIDGALGLTKSLAGTYKTTANLNLRVGAGTSRDVILTIPKGEKVNNYGYYTENGGAKWLLVAYKKYTGYVHISYLQKV